MARLIWSEMSSDDLEDIADYIAKESLHYAQQTISKIYYAAEKMADHPLSGRVVPELSNPVIREIIVGNYRVIYSTPSPDEVQIITVHHSSRMLDVDALQKYLFE